MMLLGQRPWQTKLFVASIAFFIISLAPAYSFARNTVAYSNSCDALYFLVYYKKRNVTCVHVSRPYKVKKGVVIDEVIKGHTCSALLNNATIAFNCAKNHLFIAIPGHPKHSSLYYAKVYDKVKKRHIDDGNWLNQTISNNHSYHSISYFDGKIYNLKSNGKFEVAKLNANYSKEKFADVDKPKGELKGASSFTLTKRNGFVHLYYVSGNRRYDRRINHSNTDNLGAWSLDSNEKNDRHDKPQIYIRNGHIIAQDYTINTTTSSIQKNPHVAKIKELKVQDKKLNHSIQIITSSINFLKSLSITKITNPKFTLKFPKVLKRILKVLNNTKTYVEKVKSMYEELKVRWDQFRENSCFLNKDLRKKFLPSYWAKQHNDIKGDSLKKIRFYSELTDFSLKCILAIKTEQVKKDISQAINKVLEQLPSSLKTKLVSKIEDGQKKLLRGFYNIAIRQLSNTQFFKNLRALLAKISGSHYLYSSFVSSAIRNNGKLCKVRSKSAFILFLSNESKKIFRKHFKEIAILHLRETVRERIQVLFRKHVWEKAVGPILTKLKERISNAVGNIPYGGGIASTITNEILNQIILEARNRIENLITSNTLTFVDTHVRQLIRNLNSSSHFVHLHRELSLIYTNFQKQSRLSSVQEQSLYALFRKVCFNNPK